MIWLTRRDFLVCIGIILAVISPAVYVYAQKPADTPPANVQLTEIESLKIQTLTQQRTILMQQEQLLQQQMATLTVQAKETFEAIAKAHKLNLVFDAQTFQLVPPPEPKK